MSTTTLVRGVTRVRYGVSGRKVHAYNICGAHQPGRALGVLDDQNAEITCRHCRNHMGLPLQPEAQPAHTPDEVRCSLRDSFVRVGFNTRRRSNIYRCVEGFTAHILMRDAVVYSESIYLCIPHEGEAYIANLELTEDGKRRYINRRPIGNNRSTGAIRQMMVDEFLERQGDNNA